MIVISMQSMKAMKKSIGSELFLCFMFFIVENLCCVIGEVADHYHE